ncbi:MAG: GGDEF domain-containing protein [Phycisphaerales bacterium JB038]
MTKQPPKPRATTTAGRAETPQVERRRPQKRRRRNSVLAHPALNLGALLGCSASAVVVGFVALVLRRAGVREELAIMLAWPPAAMFGWLVVDALVIRKLHRTSEQIGQLRRQLRLYANVSTRDLFERLLLKSNDEVGKLSRDIHTALTAAHQDRLESARMRRDFTHRVERETQRATHHLTRMSQTDQLTGLGNRRAFDEALATMVEETRSLGRDLACVSLDMDKFKQLNDTHGHAAGDVVLEAMGTVLAGSIRPIDFAARLGGDEFVLLLADCDVEDGARLCERISRLFGQHPEVARFGTAQPTVSYGIASLRERRGRTATQLLEASDQAMYRAKRQAKATQAA